jgi:hypothetical protein
MKNAAMSNYTSYPACCGPCPITKGAGYCPAAPSYDPTASTKECTDDSGCMYMGEFAAWPDWQCSYDWVQQNKLVAFYDDDGQSGKTPEEKQKRMEFWEEKYKLKQIKITLSSDTLSSTSFVATIVDTCDNGDCNNCCHNNSNMHGSNGKLIDLESQTLKTLPSKWIDYIKDQGVIAVTYEKLTTSMTTKCDGNIAPQPEPQTCNVSQGCYCRRESDGTPCTHCSSGECVGKPDGYCNKSEANCTGSCAGGWCGP